MRFQCAPLSPRVEAASDVGRRVDVCLVLRHPALRVRTSERRLRTSRPEVAAGVTRLRGVCGVDEPHRNPGVESFVLDASGETCERPVVETAVHPLAVIQMLADIRQVFEDDNRILELPGVLDSLSRCLLHDVGERVLVVIEPFVHTPLGVALLETAEGCEHLFAEVSRPAAVVDVGFGWSTVLTGTARQEFGFTDVEADRRRVVRLLRFRDRVLDGDVKHPVGAVLGQSELSDCHVAVEQVVPQLALCGVDAERNPEGVATPGLRDAPAELVFSVVGVVETPSSVREPDRVVVFELRSIVRVPKLRDVVLERVLRVGRERVRRDDIVDRCLRVRATLERIGEGASVRRHGTLKPLLFVRRRWRERGFKRFRGGGGHTESYNTKAHKAYGKLTKMHDQRCEIRSERRTARMANRTEKCRIPPRPKGRGFLLGQP